MADVISQGIVMRSVTDALPRLSLCLDLEVVGVVVVAIVVVLGGELGLAEEVFVAPLVLHDGVLCGDVSVLLVQDADLAADLRLAHDCPSLCLASCSFIHSRRSVSASFRP